jgi:hypothetical protein
MKRQFRNLCFIGILFCSFKVDAQTVVNFGGFETQTTLFSENFDGNWTTPNTLSPAWSQTETGDLQWHKNNFTNGWSSSTGAYSPSGANSTGGSARFHSTGNSNLYGNLISPPILTPQFNIFAQVSFSFIDQTIFSDFDDGVLVSYSIDNGASYEYVPINGHNGLRSSFGVSISQNWSVVNSSFFYVPAGSSLKIRFTADAAGYAGVATHGDIGIDQISIKYVHGGNGTWTVPENVYFMSVEGWGGGGAGGTPTSNSSCSGGGAGGSYSKKNSFSVVPGQTFSFKVGQGGQYSLGGGAGGNGENSTFSNFLIATGGNGGQGFSGSTNNGSPNSGSVGDITRLGGYGGYSFPTCSGNNGGAGGGSAGVNSNGNFTNAFYQNGGIGPGAVAGGAAGMTSIGNTRFDGNPGGGGGAGTMGVGTASLIPFSGGNGGFGNIRITYTPCPAPVISLNYYNASICIDGNLSPLSISYTGTNSTANYQWFSNSTNSYANATIIGGATNSDFTPPSNIVGTKYYFCQIYLNNTFCPQPYFSSLCSVFVNPPAELISQPDSSNVCNGGIANQMCVTYANGTLSPSYQWYSSESNNNSAGTAISGATGSCYSPPTSTDGTTYYYAMITFAGGSCSSLTSNIGKVVVIPIPIIAPQLPGTQTFCQGGSVLLNANSGPGSTYQWRLNGIDLLGAVNSNLIATSSGGYSVVVSNTAGCQLTSSVIEVSEINPTIDVQPISNQSVCVGGNLLPLEVINSNVSNGVSYQWYNSSSAAGNNAVSLTGSISNLFIPNSTVPDSSYYFCIITFDSNSNCNSLTSNASLVHVVNDIAITSSSSINQTICVGSSGNDFSVSATGGIGSINFQWYSANNNSPIPSAVNSSFNPGSFNQSAVFEYYAIASSIGGGCASANSEYFIVNVLEQPILSISPTLQNNCSNLPAETIGVTWQGSYGSPSINWFVTNEPTLGSGSILPMHDSVINVQNEQNNYYCVITFDTMGCFASSQIAQIVPVQGIYVNHEVLACESYFWNDELFEMSGSYERIISNEFACDSIITLNLTIEHGDTTYTNASSLNAFTWNGQDLVESGQYSFLTQNQFGCDSLAILNLIIEELNIQESQAEKSVFYPNPSENGLYYFTGEYSNVKILRFTNLVGEQIQYSSGVNFLDISNAESGCYLVLFEFNQKIHTEKIMK